MHLLHDNLTLKRVEELFIEQLQQVSIIGDLPLSKKDFEYIAKKIKSFIEVGATNELFKNYKASVATFLVFTAVYRFEGNTYWSYVEEYTGPLETHQRASFYKKFLDILEQLELPKFEKEQVEGYKYVTPIVCHAGIPQSCLNDYFEVATDTLNNTSFFEGHILDEFKYYMRFKVQRPVIRYLNFLGDKGEHFLQESRELLLYCDNDDASIEEAVARFSSLPKRLIEKCFVWVNTDQAKEKVKNRKNIVLTGPQIMIDAHGMGIYVFLPQQSVRESMDDAIYWEIACGDKEHSVKASLFARGEVYVSEEKTLPLPPCDTYKIRLFIEDKSVGAWEYKGLADGFIGFDNKNCLIKRNNLPPETIVIVFDKNKDLSYNGDVITEELPYLPKWTNYKTYRVNLKDANQLICNFGCLEVKKENRPKLTGGKTLFDSSEGLGANCYTRLPEIVINDREMKSWNMKTTLKHGKNDLSTKTAIIPNGVNQISLHNHIEKNQFGEYDIIIWHSSGTSNRFFIKYVPEIEYLYDEEVTWPSGSKGYTNNEFYCRFSQSIALEFENANYIGTVLKNGRDYNKYVFNNIGRYIQGKMTFTSNNQIYTLPVKKSIRPILWGFMGIGSDTAITWDSSPKKLSLKDLQHNTDAYLIISVDDSSYDYINLDISVFANNKQRLLKKSIKAENYNRYRIPLNNFLLDMQSVEESNFSFILEIYDPNGDKINECLIAKIQEDIICENFNITITREISITWNEKGAKNDREIVLYNCYMPWEEPIVIPVENGKCGIEISVDELADSMYGIRLRTSDSFAFFESEFEIPKIANMPKFCAGTIPRNLFGAVELLANTLESAFTSANNNNNDLTADILNKLKEEIDTESIKALCLSYIFIARNWKKTDGMILAIKKIRKLMRLLAQDKYTVLKEILKLNLRQKDFLGLIWEFNMLSISINDKQTFSLLERDMLWNYHSELAFIIDVQSKVSHSRICNWVGDNVIENMVDLESECSVRQCLEKLLNYSCRCSKIAFKINEDIFGSAKHLIGFFEFLTKEYFSAKRLEKYEDNQLYKVYEQQQENAELKIFGKSYFTTVQEWISSLDKTERNNIKEKLREIFREAVDTKYIVQNYPLVYRMLKSRYQDEENIEYYQGMIVFMDCLCRRGLLKPSKTLEKGISYVAQKSNPLYKRDLVVLELNLIFGGV